MIYNVFGSKSSVDRDVMVFLPELPNLEDSKKLSKEYNQKLNLIF